MTIVVPGLGKVIIVFPATPDGSVVTVGDVLVAVYLVQESSIEHHGELAARSGVEERKNIPVSYQVELKAKIKTTHH